MVLQMLRSQLLALAEFCRRSARSLGGSDAELGGSAGVLASQGLEVTLHGLASKPELNGRRGTIASAAANQKGRWEVGVPQEEGEPQVLALKLSNLMWKGRRVLLAGDAGDFGGCSADVESDAADDAGNWTVEARKTLNLKPPNLELLGEAGALRQGCRVVLRELQGSACYNGLRGVVASRAANEQGRWEVEVSKLLPLPLKSLLGVWASPLFGEMLQTKAGKRATEEVLSNKRAVLIYFSAHWCPPCRGFTPILAEIYKKYAAKDVEVVFVSSDKDNASFESYFGEMPWVALPFADRSRQAGLSAKFGVQGIPSLVALRGDGTVASANARAEVQGMGDLSKCLSGWGC